MTRLFVIDESGDTGHDSKYFTMAAIIVQHPDHTRNVWKMFPPDDKEFKCYGASSEQILKVLSAVSECSLSIAYVFVDKHDYAGMFYNMHGNKLYQAVLRQLLSSIMPLASKQDVNIIVDESRFIKKDELNQMVKEIAEANCCNVKSCMKIASHQNKNIQVADFVVGAIQRSHQGGSDYVQVIESKISIARKL